MKTFVVYEVWTRHTIVMAPSYDVAMDACEPKGIKTEDGYALNLCNWHAVEIPAPVKTVKRGKTR